MPLGPPTGTAPAVRKRTSVLEKVPSGFAGAVATRQGEEPDGQPERGRYYTGSARGEPVASATRATGARASQAPLWGRWEVVTNGAKGSPQSSRGPATGGRSQRAPRARRITISDIAQRAGVSKGAVSYALNDRPGVSDETRARILAIAAELGWYPNRAARSLSAARAGSCGLVLARPAKILALEPFFMEFISGVEAELSGHAIGLTIQLVESIREEIEVYRRWWAERRVDGVLMVDLRVDDPRVDELVRLGLPAVVVGRPLPGGVLPAIWSDEAAMMTEIVRYLTVLGHRRVARIAGQADFAHTRGRTAAFHAVATELGLAGEAVDTDFTPESGARVTRGLLSAPAPPTALIYESDLLAVTGLGVAQQMGFAVPEDVSIVAWDDSLVCQVVHPTLTAVSRDIPAYGTAAARRLLASIENEAAGDVETPRGELTPRGSTGPVRGAPARQPGTREADG
jgi:DNA-binding LacI/PurR family transcriptional regulator